MKHNLTITFLFLFIFCCSSISAQRYEKHLKKADKKYYYGDYAKAKKFLKKARKKSIKKLGEANTYIPRIQIEEGKIALAQGYLTNLPELIENTVKASDTIYTSEKDKASILVDATEIMVDYGNYRLADKYLNRAETIYKNSSSIDELIKTRLNLLKVNVLTGKGFYKDALEKINQETINNSILEDIDFKEKAQQLKIKEAFAKLLIAKANTYRLMGNLPYADSLFKYNEEWIKDNLKKTNFLWAKNEYSKVKLQEENGKSSDDLVKKYERAYYAASRKRKPSHKLIMDLQTDLMRVYGLEGKKARLDITKKEFKKSIRKLESNSIYKLTNDKVELHYDLKKQKMVDVRNRIYDMAKHPAISKKHSEYAFLVQMLRKAEILTKLYKNSVAYSRMLVDINKGLVGEDAPNYHFYKILYANDLIDFTDSIKTAGKIYEESYYNVVKKEFNESNIELINILNHLAKYLSLVDRYPEASKELDNALRVTSEKYPTDHIEYGKELNKVANFQFDIGEYEKSKKNNKIAIRLFNSINDKISKAHKSYSLVTKAKLLGIIGEYDKAENIIQDAIELEKDGALVEQVSDTKNEDLGELYLNLGKYEAAEYYINKALTQKVKIFNPKSYQLIRPYTLKARLEYIQGDYIKSEKTTNKALSIAENIFGRKSSKTNDSKILLSKLQSTIGDYQKSKKILLEVLNNQKKVYGENHLDVGKTTSKLAHAKFNKGDKYEEIKKLYEQAEVIISKKIGVQAPEYAELLKNMAIFSLASKKYELALNYIEQARDIWKDKVGRRNNINAAIVRVILGDIYYEQKKYSKAERRYENAKKQYRKVFSTSHPDYVKVQSKLSRAYFMREKYKSAQQEIEEVFIKTKEYIKSFFPALSEREKTKFWNSIKTDYEFYNTIVVSRNRSSRYIGELFDNALLTKALLLNSSIKVKRQILNSGDANLIDLYKKWIRNKEKLTVSLSLTDEEINQRGIDVSSLKNDIEKIEKELSTKSELFSNSNETKVITWKDVKNALEDNEAAIEMVRFRHFDHHFSDSVVYAMLYVKGGKRKKPKMILLNNGEELEKRYLKLYQNSIKYKVKDKYSYEKLWKPIDEEIGLVSKLYISPDGMYNQINLEAIPTPDGSYLIDKSNIVLVSNTKELVKKKQKKAVDKSENPVISIFGNPTFYVDTEPGKPLPSSGLDRSSASVVSSLPGTQREIDELNELLGEKGWRVAKFDGLEVTEEGVKIINNPKVFHIATHGFFKEPTASAGNILSEKDALQNPLLKSGLLLSGAGDILNETQYNYNVHDGILTAYEAMNLNLDKTDLVILSACETGLGKVQAGEGVYGLQRSFLVAGAKNIIMSLFKVNDEATQKLMVKFYKKWLETGDKMQAFIDAKKEIRNEYKHPIYWGAFVMVGLD